MPLIVVLIFIGFFAVIAPLLVGWSGAGNGGNKKEAIAALYTALGEERKVKTTPILDFRKRELFSSIPLLNKFLARVDLVPRLQKTLNQAELKWTPGAL